MKINKKIILIVFIFLVIVFLLLKIIFFNNKTINFGNNSVEEIKQNILNINSYEALITVTVQSNKNSNTYVMKQKCVNQNYYQEIIEPSNIEGTIIEFDGKDLKISNTKLEITKILKNYNHIIENNIMLGCFINDYTSYGSMEETETEIILKTKNETNKYRVYKNLYIDKKTEEPIKLVIQDINQNDEVYILYNEIKIM